MTGNPEWYLGQFGASNRAHWIRDWTVTDTNDVPIDLTSATFSIAIADKNNKSIIISGTQADIISLISSPNNNQFRWTFTPDQMRGLEPGPYNLGLTITLSSVTSQIFTGELMVYDGVVP